MNWKYIRFLVSSEKMVRRRTSTNIKEFLHKKGSIITIKKDKLCLARALVMAIAKIEKDPKYARLLHPKGTYQEKKARELHDRADVPVQAIYDIPEVELFQEYLTRYQINIVSASHNNTIIYPSKPSDDPEVIPIYLYLYYNQYDVITSMPGFLGKAYYCHKCRRSYYHTLDHICPDMCKSCRSRDCQEGEGARQCDECNRWFKSKTCYDHHKKPVGKGKSVCEGVKKCERCKKFVQVRQLDFKKHMCLGYVPKSSKSSYSVIKPQVEQGDLMELTSDIGE